MKKFILLLFGFLFTLSLLGQTTNREVIINNETNKNYIGLYYVQYQANKDTYITKEGEIAGDYKPKQFKIKENKIINKIFSYKDYTIKIYILEDSVYYEVIKFKLDCSRVIITMYDAYYQIIYKRYNGEVMKINQYTNITY